MPRALVAGATAAALAIASLSPRAYAEGTGVIIAGPAGAAPGAAGSDDRAALTAALVDAIGAGRRVVADAVGEARAEFAAGAVPVATLAQFRRVRDLIDEGWRAYLQVQLDVAQSRLAAARSAAEPLVALPGGAELYADAALRLGAVLLSRRISDAPAVLALAVALDPARPITLAEFSPDVVEAVAAVRAAATGSAGPAGSAGPTGSAGSTGAAGSAALERVHVASAPAGARVAIDGAVLGRAPLDAPLARGQHLVVARAPLHRAAVQGVVVGGAASIELVLERDDEAGWLATGAEPGLVAGAEQGLIDAALVFADLDDAVVAAIADRRGGPSLAVQRCAGAPARCTAVVEIGFGDRAGLAAAAREAWRSVRSAALRDPPRVIGDSEPRSRPTGCRLCRSPVLWTGVAAVVVGAALALIVRSGSKPPPVLTLHGPDFAP
jgi:hypothetical protein